MESRSLSRRTSYLAEWDFVKDKEFAEEDRLRKEVAVVDLKVV